MEGRATANSRSGKAHDKPNAHNSKQHRASQSHHNGFPGWGSLASTVPTSQVSMNAEPKMDPLAPGLTQCVLCKIDILELRRQKEEETSFCGENFFDGTGPLVLPCLHTACSLRCVTSCTLGETS